MLNPGDYSLVDFAITTPLAAQAQTSIQNLEGMHAVTIDFKFSYGSGGTNCRVWVQVSADGGQTWKDVACRLFTTSSDTKTINLSGLTPVTTAITPSDGAMADNTVQDGVLGTLMRAKITSTGTYSNTILFLHSQKSYLKPGAHADPAKEAVPPGFCWEG
jgi:hypothetical protein